MEVYTEFINLKDYSSSMRYKQLCF